MTRIKPSEHPLLQSIDAIVAKHGAENEQLAADLRLHRVQLEAALKRQKWIDVGVLSLKIASLVKFFLDNLP